MTDRVHIAREELFTPRVEASLEEARRAKEREMPEPEPVSPLRALLMSSVFYLPLAGFLGALISWIVLEPNFHDYSVVAGEVVLVNSSPFDLEIEGAMALTVGECEVVVVANTRLEPGVDGQAPFESLGKIAPGAVIEATGELNNPNQIVAMAIRPATPDRALETGQYFESDGVGLLVMPITAVLIALALLFADGLSTRNWVRMTERALLGSLLTVVFSFLAYLPAGVVLAGVMLVWPSEALTIQELSLGQFLVFTACRSGAWACMGAALGLGMNLARSTRVELRNSVIGGALGGALGGLFFDPINRFLVGDSLFQGAELSRLVGLTAVGISVGLFVALVDRLAREAWLRVKTGPLAGKSFVLYRTPTNLGSAPKAHIYLFKDTEIEPTHAAIHRVGNRFEIEDLGGKAGTVVGGRPIRRHRLTSGDQIVLGATVLEFEERAKRARTQLGADAKV